eukprot:GHVO01054549.1.p1 GENE.GHVO01054549.1~~GHVO01054549.1.p1  ORF type:complete len:272 (+),score=49.86 GHVO01054549.1:33-848(+)
MITVLEYLKHASNVCSVDGVGSVVEVTRNPEGDPYPLSVVLTSTIFFPQGGGQPSDTGVFTLATGGEFCVKKAVLDRQSGSVIHMGEWKSPPPCPCDIPPGGIPIVSQTVDTEKRLLHTQLHSAGHLLDTAVDRIGLPWTAGRGYHFPEGPYNEYHVAEVMPQKDKAPLIEKLNKQLDALLMEDPAVTTLYTMHEDTPLAPPPSTAPPTVTSRHTREVDIGGCGCACSGTHVGRAAEIVDGTYGTSGNVRVRKISTNASKKTIRVSYCVSQ